MKTVSGVVISSKPVSLSKAAKILSKFSAADNGATPAFAHYLKRASAAFDELVQHHKALQGAGSKSASKKHRSGPTQSEAEELVSSGQNHVKDDEVEEKYVEIPKEIKEPKKKRNNTVDNGDEQRIHEKLDVVENGKKRNKEGKKAGKHVIGEGGSNGVVDGARVQKDVKNVVDDGVEERINGKLDLVEDGMGGKKREKEAKKLKNHGVLNEVELDAKNVVDNGVDSSIGGKKREKKEAKKSRNQVTEDGGSNGALNEAGIENNASKKRKMKDGSVVENREENKVSKKRKSEEMAEAVNGDVNGSAEKVMKHKKRKKKN